MTLLITCPTWAACARNEPPESPACPSSRTGSELLRVMSPGRFGVVLAGVIVLQLGPHWGLPAVSGRRPHTPTRSVDSGLGKSTLHQLYVNTVVNRGCQTHALEGNIMPLAGPVSPHIHGSSSGTQGHDTAIPVPHGRGSTQSASRMKRQGPEGPAGPGMAPTSLSRTNLSSRYAPELRGQPSEKTLREAHPRDEIPKGQTDVMTSIDTFPTQPSGSTSPS